MNAVEIGWAAGFLEGEGWFSFSDSGSLTVGADQTIRSPLERLRKHFSGNIVLRKQRYNGRRAPIYTWRCYGVYAAGVAMTLYSLLSERRQEKIRRLLQQWKAQPVRPKYRPTCSKGHAYTEENTRRRRDRNERICIACERSRHTQKRRTVV